MIPIFSAGAVMESCADYSGLVSPVVLFVSKKMLASFTPRLFFKWLEPCLDVTYKSSFDSSALLPDSALFKQLFE